MKFYQSHRQRKKITWFKEKVDLTGKVAIVTGGSSVEFLQSVNHKMVIGNKIKYAG